jgi:hypothetical protein
MADKPAATLLHLGPGLSNGLANNRHFAEGLATPGLTLSKSCCSPLRPARRCAIHQLSAMSEFDLKDLGYPTHGNVTGAEKRR